MSAFLLSIPSQCTIGRKGWSGNIPNCTTHHLHSYCPSHPNVPWEGRDGVGTSQTVPPTICIPTVHPIPMYHGKEGMEWEHPKLYHPLCLHSYCPSHPNVPWEGTDGVGTSEPERTCIICDLYNYDAHRMIFKKSLHTVVSVLHECCVNHKHREEKT